MTEQTTVAGPVTLLGVGVHTGKPCRVILLPATEDTGIIFVKGLKSVPANIDYVVSTNYSTSLTRNGSKIVTVEHFLAGLYIVGVTNCLIIQDSEELPILDGSAKQIVESIQKIGVKTQKASTLKYYLPKVSLTYKHSTLIINPSNKLNIHVCLDGMFSANIVDLFDIYTSRTFIKESNIKDLKQRGLLLGGSKDCALVLDEQGFSKQTYWANEPARHKALDLVGDFSLTGARFYGNIIAMNPSHESNIYFLKEILACQDLKKSQEL